jgi:hypothetical protein
MDQRQGKEKQSLKAIILIAIKQGIIWFFDTFYSKSRTLALAVGH